MSNTPLFINAESRDLQSPGSPDIARQALMSVRGKSRQGFAP